jgi:SAM-dependent methyltransferase
MELTATERGRGHQLRDDFDESLWVQVRDFVFTQQHWDCAAREAASIAALMELSPRSRILDMPSGPGRHAIAFSALGHRVTGVDRCASYLNEACRRADAANCPVEWVCGDMRHFTSAEKFDAAVNLYTSFGYFADPADDILVLRTVQACLKNGGRFMLDLTSREILTRKDRLRERRLQFVGGHYAERSHLSDDACWLFSGRLFSGAGAFTHSTSCWKCSVPSDSRASGHAAIFTALRSIGMLNGWFCWHARIERFVRFAAISHCPRRRHC